MIQCPECLGLRDRDRVHATSGLSQRQYPYPVTTLHRRQDDKRENSERFPEVGLAARSRHLALLLLWRDQYARLLHSSGSEFRQEDVEDRTHSADRAILQGFWLPWCP